MNRRRDMNYRVAIVGPKGTGKIHADRRPSFVSKPAVSFRE
jgi:hypothetical protein